MNENLPQLDDDGKKAVTLIGSTTAAGAVLGSVLVPGAGTAVGAAIGAIAGGAKILIDVIRGDD